MKRAVRILLFLLALFFLVALGALMLLRPMDFPYTPSTTPPDLAYWELSTGSRLAYLRTPSATTTTHPSPVVFVHGGPGLPELMDGVVRQAVAELGFDVYTYHQFGAGLSNRAVDRQGEYTVARHIADLEAIRDALGAQRLILVGQSWGATLSASYAAAHPLRIQKLVLTSPGPSWLPAFDADKIRVFNNLSEDNVIELSYVVKPHVRRLAMHRRLLNWNPWLADRFLSERQLDGFVAAQGHITQRAFVCDPAAARERSFSGQGYWVNHHVFADLRQIRDPRPDFSQVKAPVLILRGECDYVDEEIAGDFERWFPAAEWVQIEGAGHEIRWERLDRYLEILQTFLADPES